ncbi:SET domain-containing protein [Cavenderia fasciculata]|uniref:SET domain-containing protein n=1 Tax=Cavenderia fasciculata TaxID=261658 RepID=F4Q9F3_CACFS|nr:SET domain-containing protein [Cavenderia fasciculata]EGG15322.1 SET domain-containing protein [Cavenderia fasciculata]|eukprot:XP_004352042.1 SET domain-containing protein [Cavenderia fasciculata]
MSDTRQVVEEGKIWREKGNKQVSVKEYDSALESYTQAIRLNPSDYAALTNRSWVYFLQSKWQSSLVDAQASININQSWVKGYYRKAIALKQLKRYRDAIDTLDYAIKSPVLKGTIHLTDTKLFINEIDTITKSIIDYMTLQQDEKTTTKQHQQVDKVDIKMIGGDLGKGVFTQTGIQANTAVTVEYPLVSHISCKYLGQYLDQGTNNNNNNNKSSTWYQTCSHCMENRIRDPTILSKLLGDQPYREIYSSLYPNSKEYIVCGHCKVEYYCSESCQQLAWSQYHQIQCPHMSIIKQQLYPHCIENEQTNPLIISRMFAMVLQSIIYQQKEFTESIIPFTFFISNGQWQSKGDEKVLSILKSIFKNESQLDQVLTIERYRQFNSIIQCNASKINPLSRIHMLIEKNTIESPALQDYIQLVEDGPKVPFGEPLLNLLESLSDCCVHGSGLYVYANSCNHSCSPNAAITNESTNFSATIRSITDIPNGNQIEISYIEEDQPSQTRQSELIDKYKFKCHCQKCTNRIIK